MIEIIVEDVLHLQFFFFMCAWLEHSETKICPMRISEYILYADDDQDDIELLKTVFRDADPGRKIITVCNGEEVIHYLDKLSDATGLPCLIIMDVNMPKMTGDETLVHIKEDGRYKEVPVVLFSTSSEFSDLALLQKYGTGFVSKPKNFEGWKTVTAQLLEFCNQSVRV
jgi:CheY-like chemotaxis protein